MTPAGAHTDQATATSADLPSPSAFEPPTSNDSDGETVARLARSVSSGAPWAPALLEAIGRWTAPREYVDGQELRYLVGGEAFDWLLLAERLVRALAVAVPGAVPAAEAERLLFTGELPPDVSQTQFREALGVGKYRAHLNFFYGVVVEEALWHAVEREVLKERGVRGLHHLNGVQEAVSQRLYRAGTRRADAPVPQGARHEAVGQVLVVGAEGIHLLVVQAPRRPLGLGQDRERHAQGARDVERAARSVGWTRQ